MLLALSSLCSETKEKEILLSWVLAASLLLVCALLLCKKETSLRVCFLRLALLGSLVAGEALPFSIMWLNSLIFFSMSYFYSNLRCCLS